MTPWQETEMGHLFLAFERAQQTEWALEVDMALGRNVSDRKCAETGDRTRAARKAIIKLIEDMNK